MLKILAVILSFIGDQRHIGSSLIFQNSGSSLYT